MYWVIIVEARAARCRMASEKTTRYSAPKTWKMKEKYSAWQARGKTKRVRAVAGRAKEARGQAPLDQLSRSFSILGLQATCQILSSLSTTTITTIIIIITRMVTIKIMIIIIIIIRIKIFIMIPRWDSLILSFKRRRTTILARLITRRNCCSFSRRGKTRGVRKTRGINPEKFNYTRFIVVRESPY